MGFVLNFIFGELSNGEQCVGEFEKKKNVYIKDLGVVHLVSDGLGAIFRSHPPPTHCLPLVLVLFSCFFSRSGGKWTFLL